MSGERGTVTAALLAALVLGVGSWGWAAEPTRAEQVLQEEVARQRIVEQKREVEARALLGRAQELYRSGRFQEALEPLQRALRLEPTLEEAQRLLAQVRGELGLKPAEERLLERQVRRREVAREALRARVEGLLSRAAEQRRARRYEEALDTLRSGADLVRLSPYRDELAELARRASREAQAAARERDRYQVRQAEERRRQALRLAVRRKEEAQAQLRATERQLLSQARTLFEKGRYDEAARMAQVVANVDPDSTEAYLLLRKAQRQLSREEFLALSDERAENYRTQWAETQRATIPLGERKTIVYPQDWKELTRRREAVAAAALGPPKPVWRSRLEGQLEREVGFEFTEAPLSQVVEFLGTVGDANIVLDRRGIQAAGKDPDMPITLKIRKVSLADALDWVMDLSDLTYTLRKGAILISDPTQIPKETSLATYDVRDLLSSVPDFAGPSFDLESEGGGGDGGGGGGFDIQTEQTGGGGAGAATGQIVSMQMSGEELVQFIIQALGLEGEAY